VKDYCEESESSHRDIYASCCLCDWTVAMLGGIRDLTWRRLRFTFRAEWLTIGELPAVNSAHCQTVSIRDISRMVRSRGGQRSIVATDTVTFRYTQLICNKMNWELTQTSEVTSQMATANKEWKTPISLYGLFSILSSSINKLLHSRTSIYLFQYLGSILPEGKRVGKEISGVDHATTHSQRRKTTFYYPFAPVFWRG